MFSCTLQTLWTTTIVVCAYFLFKSQRFLYLHYTTIFATVKMYHHAAYFTLSLPRCNHAFLPILDLRIWCKIVQYHLVYFLSYFFSAFSLKIYGYCKEKFIFGHFWEWEGLTFTIQLGIDGPYQDGQPNHDHFITFILKAHLKALFKLHLT